MCIRLVAAILGVTFATPVEAQTPALRLDAFSFEGGAVTHTRTATAPQLAASAIIEVAGHSPLELTIGSAVADLREHAGHQRDLFVSATRVWTPVPRYITFGAGVSLHALRTRIDGAATAEALADLERERSGLRPALAALLSFALPLAPANAAALHLTARAALLRDARRLSLGAGIRLAPGLRGIRLGEPAAPAPPVAAAGSWDALVGQIMIMQDGSGAHDAIATRTTLTLKFAPRADTSAATTISRMARILAASKEALQLEIAAPMPAAMAMAATAAGFPPERIRLAHDRHAITVRAIRAAVVPQSESAQR